MHHKNTLLISLALFACLLLISGCSSEAPQGSSPAGQTRSNVSSDAPELVKEIASLNSSISESPAPSIDLVKSAFASGEITEEEYVLQSAYSLFEPEKLDSRFSSETPSNDHPSFLLWKISGEFESYSEETQEALLPYILGPDDPKSYWYSDEESEFLEYDEPALQVKEKSPDSEGVAFFSPPDTTALFMDHPHPSGKKIMIKIPSGFGTEEALKILAGFNEAYPKYVDMGMKEPTDWIHVEVKPLKWDGLAKMAKAYGKRRCVIYVNSGLKGKDKQLKATAAHELFHCFQYAMPLKSGGDYEWIAEATAVWAEEFVFPKYNTEHVFDGNIFSKFNYDFLDQSESREYGSYLWFFYLYQNQGKTSPPIKKALDDAVASDVRTAMENTTDFKREFHEYALWNLNWGHGIKFYVDEDNMPSLIPFGNSVDTDIMVMGDTEFPQSVSLKKGGIKYYIFDVGGEDVKKVVFNLEKINRAHDPDSGIWVVFDRDGYWTYFDASEEKEVKFCRTRPSEKVSRVIFIVSNSNLREELNGEIGVDARGVCEPEWSGYVRVSWKSGRTNSISGVGISAYGDSGYYFVRETLVYDSEEDEFLVKSASATYTRNEKELSKYFKSCGRMRQTRIDTTVGGGQFKVKPSAEDIYTLRDELPYRITPVEDEPGFYEWRPRVIESALTAQYTSRITDVWVDCLGTGITTPKPDTEQSIDYHGTLMEPDTFEYPKLKMSEDGKRLSASYSGTRNDDGLETSWQFIAEYSRD